MKANYFETIFYKGFEYKFEDDNFIDKNEIKDSEMLEKSQDVVVKIIEDKETKEITSTEYKVEEEIERKEGE